MSKFKKVFIKKFGMVDKALSLIKRIVKKANTLYILIPAKLATDSKFPFKEGEQVLIEIDEWAQALVIKRIRK